MRALHVVRLVERVDAAFQFAGSTVVSTDAGASVEVVRREQLRERIEEVEQRLGAGVEVHEHEPAPAVDEDRLERRSSGSDGEVVAVDDLDAPAVERVAPARGTGSGTRRRRTCRGPSASRVPRCRHTLWNAWIAPVVGRGTTSIDWSPMSYTT